MIKHAAALTALLLTTLPLAAEEIGARARSGFPESFFLEKTPRAEAKSTAESSPHPVLALRF